jgi:hypothetical protein
MGERMGRIGRIFCHSVGIFCVKRFLWNGKVDACTKGRKRFLRNDKKIRPIRPRISKPPIYYLVSTFVKIRLIRVTVL